MRDHDGLSVIESVITFSFISVGEQDRVVDCRAKLYRTDADRIDERHDRSCIERNAEIDENSQFNTSYQNKRQGQRLQYEEYDQENRAYRNGRYDSEVPVGYIDQILCAGRFPEQTVFVVALDDIVDLYKLIIDLIAGNLIFCRDQKQLVIIADQRPLQRGRQDLLRHGRTEHALHSQNRLDAVHITANKNTIPRDPASPFVTSGLRTGRYEVLESLPIDTLYGVDGMARERREQFRPTRNLQLTLGIVLCVLAVIPVFLSLVLYGEEDHFGHLAAVALLLALVAVGVLLIVRSSILWGSYQILLEEGDYSRAAKEANARALPFNSIYWGLVTAGFLAWGFLGNAWERCWIVWPVAGVAYGAVYGIVSALRKR